MLFILIKQDLSQCVTCQEKHITVKKEPHESLGMTVAGGRGSKSGELPIFVTSVQPHGCLARDGRIKRGGVWLPWWHSYLWLLFDLYILWIQVVSKSLPTDVGEWLWMIFFMIQ